MDGPSESRTDALRRVIRDSARAFVRQEGGSERLKTWRGRVPGFDRTLWRRMAAQGWIGLILPKGDGGSGFGADELVTLAEELGRRPVPEPVLAGGMVTAVVLALCDGIGARAQWLPAVLAGDRMLALAWQEHATGLDPDAVGARAVAAGGGFVLDGRKRVVWAAAGADGFLVSACEGGAIGLYLVERDTAGLGLDLDPLADGGFIGTLTLDKVRVAADRRLASAAVASGALSVGIEIGTLGTSAELLGLAEQLFAITLNHLRERRQFGHPIGSFQALQHRAADLCLQLALTRAALTSAVAAVRSDDDPASRLACLSAAKARASATALRVAQEAVQLHGAHGTVDDHLVGLYLKRALVLAAAFGGEAEHRRRHAALAGAAAPAAPAARPAPPPDDLADLDALDDNGFRGAVRGWIEAHYPHPLRHLDRRPRWPEIRGWYLALARQGWIAPGWPKSHGGLGWNAARQLILVEEQERWGCARLPEIGPGLVGPLLIRFGSEEQQQRFLPRILTGEQVWAQGYSEPEAGSDLASLQTAAVRDGEDYVVTGRKTWVTLGQDADWMVMLVRTAKTAKPQHGISLLMVDLRAPGIALRPIVTLAGHEDMAEVTLDRVRVPAANLIGLENQGWTIAKTQLGLERLHFGHPEPVAEALRRLEALAAASGSGGDPAFGDRLAALRLDVADLRALYDRFAGQARQGEALGPEVSLLKLWASETHQRIGELMVALAGVEGVVDAAGAPLPLYLASRALSIAGGANEIQRTIIAKHVLGLP